MGLQDQDLPAHLYQTAPRSSLQPSHQITTFVGKHPTSKPCIHQIKAATNQRIGQNWSRIHALGHTSKCTYPKVHVRHKETGPSDN